MNRVNPNKKNTEKIQDWYKVNKVKYFFDNGRTYREHPTISRKEALIIIQNAYQTGFKKGIDFIDEELGDCISDKLDQFAEQGEMPDGTLAENYDWDKVAAKQLKKTCPRLKDLTVTNSRNGWIIRGGENDPIWEEDGSDIIK